MFRELCGNLCRKWHCDWLGCYFPKEWFMLAQDLKKGCFILMFFCLPAFAGQPDVIQQHKNGPAFLTQIKADSVTIETLNEDKTGKHPPESPAYTLLLKGVSPFTLYAYYIEPLHIGFVQTKALTAVWRQATLAHYPSVVVLTLGKKRFLLFVVTVKQLTDDVILVSVVQPMHASQLLAKVAGSAHLDLPKEPMKSGVYHSVVMTSDMLPLDIRALPRSICSPDSIQKDCLKQPMKVQA
jgi:hypothetical protein